MTKQRGDEERERPMTATAIGAPTWRTPITIAPAATSRAGSTVLDRGRIVEIDYTNYKGERSWRRVRPISIHFECNNFHPGEPQWFMEAFALDRLETRMFALASIHEWRIAKP